MTIIDPDAVSIQVEVGSTAGGLSMTKQDKKSEQFLRNTGPDTIDISNEAKALLKAKMEEYGAMTPGDLSPEEIEDIKKTMAESEVVTVEDKATLDRIAGMASGEGPRGVGGPPSGGATGMQGPPPKKGGDQSESDEVTDLEDEIEDLKEEIEELRVSSTKNAEDKEELKAKKVELSILEAELRTLTASSSANS